MSLQIWVIEQSVFHSWIEHTKRELCVSPFHRAVIQHQEIQAAFIISNKHLFPVDLHVHKLNFELLSLQNTPWHILKHLTIELSLLEAPQSIRFKVIWWCGTSWSLQWCIVGICRWSSPPRACRLWSAACACLVHSGGLPTRRSGSWRFWWDCSPDPTEGCESTRWAPPSPAAAQTHTQTHAIVLQSKGLFCENAHYSAHYMVSYQINERLI